MLPIGKTIVSDDLRDIRFACDLQRCKGACCIDGDAGAPLEEEEIALLEEHLEQIKPFMLPAGIREVEKNGVFDYDSTAKYVTPLAGGKECAYIYFENGIARCAIEKAFADKKIPFRKPISCHLYPVRIREMKKGDAVNYHRWHICQSALEAGKRKEIPLYRFLEEALVRKYGREWYEILDREFDPGNQNPRGMDRHSSR